MSAAAAAHRQRERPRQRGLGERRVAAPLQHAEGVEEGREVRAPRPRACSPRLAASVARFERGVVLAAGVADEGEVSQRAGDVAVAGREPAPLARQGPLVQGERLGLVAGAVVDGAEVVEDSDELGVAVVELALADRQHAREQLAGAEAVALQEQQQAEVVLGGGDVQAVGRAGPRGSPGRGRAGAGPST